MDRERFGSCTNIGECEAVCPKEIGLPFIARMNRDLIAASFKWRRARRSGVPR
jgi:succinate dehydrogenase / fumarate reductase iron-sulfur subunit